MPVTIPLASRAIIRTLRARAEDTPTDLSDVLTQTLVPRSQAAHISVGDVFWLIVYSLEEQLMEKGETFSIIKCRHLTISHPDRKTLPTGEVAEAIAAEFGFQFGPEGRRVFSRPYPRRGMTLHYMEPMEAI